MFLRLIRQMGYESITYISTIQDFERSVKFEREISTSVLRIYQRDEIECFKMAISLYRKLIKLIDFYLNLRVRFARKKNKLKASRRKSKLKLIRFKCLSRIKYLRAAGFVRYRGIQYSRSEDVGKKPDDCVAPAGYFDLLFPIQWCYGSVDSYAYSIVYDYLSLKSIDHDIYKDVVDPDIDDEKRLEEIYRYLDSILARNTIKTDKNAKEDNLPDTDIF